MTRTWSPHFTVAERRRGEWMIRVALVVAGVILGALFGCL